MKTIEIKTLVIFVVLSFVLAYIAATGLKLLFHTPRPCELIDTCPSDFSFPSRQTTIAFATATALVLQMKKKYSYILFVLAALVGLSRLVLGVHTIYDVVGGTIIGILVGYATYYLFRKYLKRIFS